LFVALSTQWRIGMGGPTGLDYAVMYMRMDRMKLSDEEWECLEADMRTLEDAALEVMREQRNE